MENLILTRTFRSNFGIFGSLVNLGQNRFVTLEHAYPSSGFPSFAPKFPDGEYICTRGFHRLEGMQEPFETFCLDVPGHADILIHPGNWNKDSEGCILIGKGIITSNNGWMISNSKESFELFMRHMKGVDRFTLNIKSTY